MTLGQLYAFLKQADKNHWFVFYICDKNGLLRAVCAGWSGYGWCVNACSVEDPRRWYGGDRVVSPNS
jgi:hypothetical protein